MMNSLAECAIETELIAACPACDADGCVKLKNCADYVSHLPGGWTFYQCPSCQSLWPNPRPLESALPLLYPSAYTCTRSIDAREGQRRPNLVARLKQAVLAQQFGYEAALSAQVSNAAALFSAVFGRLLRYKAGHSIRFLSAVDHGRLLDIGCGNGAFMQTMSQLGWSVQGVEADHVAAQRAIDRGMDVHIGMVQNVEFPESHFDAITLTHVAEHLFDPVQTFAAVHRWLKPNGVLVSISPNPRSIVRQIFGNTWYALDPPRHVFLPSAAAYHRMLEPLGFEVATWTSRRLFHWYFKESLSIALHGKVNAIKESAALCMVTSIVSSLLCLVPESGEEVICYARRR